MLDKRRFLILLTIVFAAGVTPIAIRITQGEGMPSSVIVVIRLWLVTLGLLPLVWSRYRRQLLRLTRRQWLWSAIAGFWLAVNLLLLFVALEYTSVLMTSLLRRTSPIWIVLPEIVLFGVVFSRRFWLSLVVTVIGVALVGFGGLSAIEAGSDPLLGGALALGGSFCFGAYLLIGRQLNNIMPPLLYSFLVFFSAALVTSVFVALSRTPLVGYPALQLFVGHRGHDFGAGAGAYFHEPGAAILQRDGAGYSAASGCCAQRCHRAFCLRRGSVAVASHRQRPGHLRRHRRHGRADAGSLAAPAGRLTCLHNLHLTSWPILR